MKGVRVAFAFVTALGFSGAANAADFSGFPEPPPPPEFSWEGLYIGISGGYGGDRFEYPFSYSQDCCGYIYDKSLSGQFDITSSGFVYGAQVGYNLMLDPHWLLGIEADIQGTSIKGNLGFHLDPSFDVNAGSKVDWFGTIRGRIGWADGRFLLYATGGWAYGKATAYANATYSGSPIFDLSKSANLSGFAVGGGAEYAITDHWTLKTEYLYVDLGKNNLLSYVGSAYNCDIAFNLDQKTKFHVVRAGLNYKF
jgi:outer membrane immunogenic protein